MGETLGYHMDLTYGYVCRLLGRDISASIIVYMT